MADPLRKANDNSSIGRLPSVTTAIVSIASDVASSSVGGLNRSSETPKKLTLEALLEATPQYCGILKLQGPEKKFQKTLSAATLKELFKLSEGWLSVTSPELKESLDKYETFNQQMNAMRTKWDGGVPEAREATLKVQIALLIKGASEEAQKIKRFL